MSYHEPVLLQEVLTAFAPIAGKTFCDATLGGGGHTEALLAAGAAKVYGVDRDPEALRYATQRLAETKERFVPLLGNFRNPPLPERVDGILLDLGVSSAQLDRPERGFSFRAAGPLDMRMGTDAQQSLSEYLATVEAEELARVLWEYGEERKSRAVARSILRARDNGELQNTWQLAEAIRRVVGRSNDKIDPATRSFQGLRIAINEELSSLEEFLQKLPDLLSPNGIVAIISYHSLEDRITKHSLRRYEKPCVCPPDLPYCHCNKQPLFTVRTKHPIEASEAEIARNPRARSAKLRIAQRLPR